MNSYNIIQNINVLKHNLENLFVGKNKDHEITNIGIYVFTDETVEIKLVGESLHNFQSENLLNIMLEKGYIIVNAVQAPAILNQQTMEFKNVLSIFFRKTFGDA